MRKQWRIRNMSEMLLRVAVTTACSPSYYPAGSYSPGPPPSTVWMVKQVNGGRQCGPHISYEPQVEERLEAERVSVHSHKVRSAPVCSACRCASYSARHYVQVLADQEKATREVGFQLAAPPEKR
jgi:hypothetical protein